MQLSVRRRACTLVTVLTSADERGHWCVRAIVHLSFPINPLHTYSYTVLLLFQPNGSEATLRFWLHLHLNAHVNEYAYWSPSPHIIIVALLINGPISGDRKHSSIFRSFHSLEIEIQSLS